MGTCSSDSQLGTSVAFAAAELMESERCHKKLLFMTLEQRHAGCRRRGLMQRGSYSTLSWQAQAREVLPHPMQTPSPSTQPFRQG